MLVTDNIPHELINNILNLHKRNLISLGINNKATNGKSLAQELGKVFVSHPSCSLYTRML